MNQTSFKSIWLREYEKEREYFADEVQPFEDWNALTGHGGIAELYLANGLCAAYADGNPAVVQKFLEAAISIVGRAESEQKFDRDRPAKAGFPMNRAVALRTRAYAMAVVTGELPVRDLIQASKDFDANRTRAANGIRNRRQTT